VSELDQIETRAQRHLDGMTVNRDAMARDVLKLARALRRLASEVPRAQHAPQSSTKATPDWLRDLFGGV